MAIRELRVESDPILQTKTALVQQIDQETRDQIQDMLDTMYAEDGIGLAANQIGLNKRMFVMDISSKEEEPNPFVFINPEIVWLSEEKVSFEEGCLSVPGVYAPVIRSQRCRVRYRDIENKEQILEAEELMAVCIQHEVDHLNGLLFIDHLSHLKRKMLVNKSRKHRKKD